MGKGKNEEYTKPGEAPLEREISFVQIARPYVEQAKRFAREQYRIFRAGPSEGLIEEYGKKPKLYRNSYFWIHWSFYYPYGLAFFYLLFMIIALSRVNDSKGHLLLGSIISLVSTLSVLCSYFQLIPWRKHPSILIVYRAMANFVFSINVIMNAVNVTDNSCRRYSIINEYTLLCGECFLLSIAYDLVSSLTNPFRSYKTNLRRYQISIGAFTSIITIIFSNHPECMGEFDKGICWLTIVNHVFSPCLWGYFLSWIMIMYAYICYASVFSYLRLQSGLEATFEIRKKVADDTFRCLAVYVAYTMIIVLSFAIIAGDPMAPPGTPAGNFSLLLLYVVANRGSVDGIVWFTTQSFTVQKSDVNEKTDEEVGVRTEDSFDESMQSDVSERKVRRRFSSMEAAANLMKKMNVKDIKEMTREAERQMKKTIEEAADLAIADVDESDLSPQVNTALRKQIVSFVVNGITEAINLGTLIGEPKNLSLKNVIATTVNIKQDPALIPNLAVTEFLLEGEYPFKSYAPKFFEAIRKNEGMNDLYYKDVIGRPASERLSEGASGAFMFFCGGGEFIVKTIRAREARVLHSMLEDYANYLHEERKSLLCRIIGSYSLRIYEQDFYFVVMLNCFNPKAVINERYDIKGSWVGRSSEPSRASKKVLCRHCCSYFLPSAAEQCTVVVGCHEADIVLKDNDLRSKIILGNKDALHVRDIIKKDSDLLGRFGVMDYSLLIGVKKQKFDVHVEDSEMGFSDNDRLGRHATFKAKSLIGPAVYSFGIVDFLQDWTVMKKVERALKTYVSRKDPDGLSVMPPEQYMVRFQLKMDQIFELSEELKKSDSLHSLKSSLSSNSLADAASGGALEIVAKTESVAVAPIPAIKREEEKVSIFEGMEVKEEVKKDKAEVKGEVRRAKAAIMDDPFSSGLTIPKKKAEKKVVDAPLASDEDLYATEDIDVSIV